MDGNIYETIERLEALDHRARQDGDGSPTPLDRGEFAILRDRLANQLNDLVGRIIPFEIIHVCDGAQDESAGVGHVTDVEVFEHGILLEAELDDIVDAAVETYSEDIGAIADVNESLVEIHERRVSVEVAGGEHLADLGLLASLNARVEYGSQSPSDREIELLEELSARVAPIAEQLLSRYVAAGLLGVVDGNDAALPRHIFGIDGYDGTQVILRALPDLPPVGMPNRGRRQRRPKKTASSQKRNSQEKS